MFAKKYMDDAIASGKMDDLEHDLGMPGTAAFQMHEKLEEIKRKISATKELHDVVDAIMWIEVKRQHPDLASKRSIGVRANWSLTWSDGKQGCGGCVACAGAHGVVEVGQGDLGSLLAALQAATR